MAYRFEPLAKQHDRAAFRCASAPLNAYLQQFARKDAERHVAAAFVMVPVDAPATIVGYYTLSAFTVELAELPEAMGKKLPRYPRLPATLLGRLARDVKFPGTGALLLMDALVRAHRKSAEIASLAVVADAKDAAALAFYRRFGFAPLGGGSNRVFLPMGTVAELVGKRD
ncbi:MAG: GNAT family N-acetyltransferase [Verrucomicrobiota bacterium]